MGFIATCFAAPNSVNASEKTPIFIEMFSSVTCPTDPYTQKELYKMLQDFPNAVLVNCRTGALLKEKEKVDKFAQKHCDEKMGAYFVKLKMFGLKSPMVIVNGKYDTNIADIPSALKMAQSVDDIKNIPAFLEGKTLHIEIPDIGVNKGEIYVYTYAPTHELTVTPPAPAQDPNQPILPKSEPFEGTKAYTEFYLRPVVAITKLSDWNGKEKKLSYPLPVIDTFDFNISDLSYVVVLTSGKENGDVLAVGELKSQAEIKAKPNLETSPSFP